MFKAYIGVIGYLNSLMLFLGVAAIEISLLLPIIEWLPLEIYWLKLNILEFWIEVLVVDPDKFLADLIVHSILFYSFGDKESCFVNNFKGLRFNDREWCLEILLLIESMVLCKL